MRLSINRPLLSARPAAVTSHYRLIRIPGLPTIYQSGAGLRRKLALAQHGQWWGTSKTHTGNGMTYTFDDSERGIIALP